MTNPGEEPGNDIEKAPTDKEKFDRELDNLRLAFTNFFKEFKDLQRDPEVTAAIRDHINIGRFRRQHLDEHPELGFTGSKARMVYGDMVPEGNAEGSMYTFFGKDELRVRWEGKQYVQVFLNGGHTNRFDMMPHAGGEIEPQVMYLGGRLIARTAEGLKVSNPDHWQWRLDNDTYEGEVERIKRDRRRIFGRPKQQEPLPMPPVKPPEYITIPYGEALPLLKEVVGKLQKGFALTVLTYEEALHMANQPPAIEHDPKPE